MDDLIKAAQAQLHKETAMDIELEGFDPRPSEVIVIRFPHDLNSNDALLYDVDTIQGIHEEVSRAFPNNIVVGFPDDILLQSCTKAQIQDIIRMLTEAMEE